MPSYEITIPGRGKYQVASETPLSDAEAYQYALQQARGAPDSSQKLMADLNKTADQTQADLAYAQATGGSLMSRQNAQVPDPSQMSDLERQVLGLPPKEAPESLTQRILRYGRNAAGIALPTAGGMLGAAGGLATPVPGGALMGEIAGSAGGEYLAQKLGLSEPSAAQIGLAAAAPIGGRALGALGKALPVSRAGAISKIASLLPSESSAALFGKAGTNGLSQAEAQPFVQGVLDSATRLGKAGGEGLERIFDKVSGKQISFTEANAIKDELQGYANHFSHLGGANYNPTAAAEYKALKQTLLNQLDAVNPGYKAALEAYGREQNVGRLQTLISKSSDPAKALSELRSTPLSDLTPKNKLLLSGFDAKELDEVQNLLQRLPKGLSLRGVVEGRIGGAMVGGALGYQQGGSKEAIGGGIIAGMLAYPIGRRMLSEMIKTGAINNPSKMATAAQIFRATVARLPRPEQPPE